MHYQMLYTDMCLTTIHRALTLSEMQTCPLDVKSHFITLVWKKGYINVSGSRCAGSRNQLCNGPLMAAMDDRQPEALPPETLRNPVLTSADRLFIQDMKMSEDHF